MLPTPRELVAHLDRFVIGQARAKRALATAVYTHFLLAAARRTVAKGEGPAGESAQGSPATGSPSPGARSSARQHVLLLGPTGSGKSLLVRTLAQFLGLPFVRADATRITETGYVGEDVTGLLFRLVRAAGKDRDRAETGIVFLDEIDKLAAFPDTVDVSRGAVQQALLSILDGGEHAVSSRGDSEMTIDTSFVWFVCAGAFPGLDKVLERRVGARERLGFEAGATPSRPSLHEVCAEDFERYGFLPELIGRFGTITALDELAEPELAEILRGAEGGAVARERELFALHGIELAIPDEVYEGLARRAVRAGTGARALDRTLHEVFAELHFDLPELAAHGVRSVRLCDPERSGAPQWTLEHEPLLGEHASEHLHLRQRIGTGRGASEEPRSAQELLARGEPASLKRMEERSGVATLDDEARGLYEALRRQFVGRDFELVWLFEQLERARCRIDDLVHALGEVPFWELHALLSAAQLRRQQILTEEAREARRERFGKRHEYEPPRRRERRSRWRHDLGRFVRRLSPLERYCLDQLGEGELPVCELLLRLHVAFGGALASFLARAEVGLGHLVRAGLLCAFDGRQPNAPDLDGGELFPLREKFRWNAEEQVWEAEAELRYVELYRASEARGSDVGVG